MCFGPSGVGCLVKDLLSCRLGIPVLRAQSRPEPEHVSREL